MATTLEFIAQCLQERGWKYEFDGENARIITGVASEQVEDFAIIFKLTENGEYLQFIAPQIMMVKDHVYKGVLLQTMAHFQYQKKMLRLEYDTSDGEIRASIELPLEDAILTERQFNRCLEGLVHLVNEAVPRFTRVLQTGEDPGMPNIEEQVQEVLEMIRRDNPEILSEFMRFLGRMSN